ncbi:MAG: flagellar M-ring protein FliF, partial [Alphaproteobacteria bacterium]|nr:flagellar M-ring protein FliF [Alphaproteobacteria bacterium]
MDDLKAFLQNLGASKLFVLLATALVSFAFLAYLIFQTTKPTMSLLFAHLESADAGRIIDRLESMGIPVEARGDGSQLYVPEDKIARIRMDLAQAGMPGSGTIGYEIFDKTDLLGTSSAVMDINYVRAMEGELSKSIRSIQGVSSARVHLVMPKKEIFSRDRVQPSASIVLKMNHGRLSQGQVLGIQHLVAAAVSGLSAEKITIVDDKGSLLARQNEDGSFDVSNNQEMRSAHEQKLAQTIEGLLEKTLGPGKARVEVNADMDFDKVTISSEEFNPDGQVVRSTSTTGENGSSSDQSNGGTVSVQNALPEGDKAGASAGGGSNSKNSRNEDSTNYEISKTQKTQIKESGTVKRLSVAVLVDGTYGQDGKYQARPKEQMDQLATLVKTAVGFNNDRGDVVELVNLPFAPGEAPEPPMGMADKMLSQISLSHIANIAIPGLIGLLTLLLFVKPFIRKVLEQIKESRTASAMIANTMVDAETGNMSAGGPALLEGDTPPPITSAQQI